MFIRKGIPMGKNAKKRAARKVYAAMLECNAAFVKMPHAFHIIDYKDGQRRHLKFASITAYKNYLKEFHNGKKPPGLVLVGKDSLSEMDDSKGQANRTRATNKGVGLHNGKRLSLPAFNDKAPKSMTQDGFKVTDSDAWKCNHSDYKVKEAIVSEKIRPSHKGKLEAIRQKYRTI